ncbi:MAG: hypothetical protein ACI9DJ_003261, partial [Algoriphagus sp.]
KHWLLLLIAVIGYYYRAILLFYIMLFGDIKLGLRNKIIGLIEKEGRD